MKAGKVSEPMLKRSVLKRISYKDKDIFSGAGLCRDFASMLISEDEEIILSTDTVTYGHDSIAVYGINRTANNIAVSGGHIKGVMVSVTMPGNTMESELNFLMRDIASECKKRRIEIIGGHTETVDYVNKMVVSFTGVGVRKKTTHISVDNIRPGMDIVMSKDIAIEGTALMAYANEEMLCERFQRSFVDMAKRAIEDISIVKEAAIAAENGVAAMHDISNGGAFGALWELAAGVNLGLSVYLDKISVRQETIELCEILDINPYTLVSGGALLMVTEDGAGLENALNEAGIKASVIGQITADKDRVIIKGEDRRFLEPPKGDEIVRKMASVPHKKSI